jgi:hypothetical protein
MRACRTEDRTRPTFPTRSWAFVAPYLALVRRDAPQRTHDLREVLDALRWIVRAGAPCGGCSVPRLPALGGRLPADAAVGLAAGVFETMAHDLRGLCCGSGLRPRAGAHEPEPASRSPRRRTSTAARCAPPPESGARGGYDGAKNARRAPRSTRRWTPWLVPTVATIPLRSLGHVPPPPLPSAAPSGALKPGPTRCQFSLGALPSLLAAPTLAAPARHPLLGREAYAKRRTLSTHRRSPTATPPRPRRGRVWAP